MGDPMLDRSKPASQELAPLTIATDHDLRVLVRAPSPRALLLRRRWLA